MVKVLPDRFTVCCDYDHGRAPKIPQIRAIVNRLGFVVRQLEDHRTRRGWHMVLRVSPALEPAERIVLELLLGSDPNRATLDLMREVAVRRGDFPRFWRRRTAMLFERKLT